jgi:hypothetical protein
LNETVIGPPSNPGEFFSGFATSPFHFCEPSFLGGLADPRNSQLSSLFGLDLPRHFFSTFDRGNFSRGFGIVTLSIRLAFSETIFQSIP